MSQLTAMPNFFNNLPIDNIAEIISKLNHEDAIKVRRTCLGMNNIFNEYRAMIDGPQCDASITYINNTLELKIQCGDSRHCPRIISLHNWSFEFRNATCHNLEIFTDSSLPDHLIKKLLCCWKIYQCEYKGEQISKAWIEGLSSVVREKFDVNVKTWSDKMEGSPQLDVVNIVNPINGLDQIVELSKTTLDFTFSIDLKDFEKTINSFKNIPTESVYIDEWTINLENVPSWRNPTSVVNLFIQQIDRISETGFSWRCEPYGSPSGWLIRIAEYGT